MRIDLILKYRNTYMKMRKQILLIATFLFISGQTFATDYYVNAYGGKDSNNGKSKSQAFKTLKKINNLNLKAGDRVLLAKGQVFYGNLQLIKKSGKAGKPIVITSYSTGKSDVNATINAKGFDSGVKLMNCSYVTVENLIITADGDWKKPGKGSMRSGVFYAINNGSNQKEIHIKNIHVKEVYYENKGFQRGAKEVKTANGTQKYGWGIRFLIKNKQGTLKDATVENCRVEHVGHTGIKINGKIFNLKVANNTIFKTGGPGMQFSGLKDAHVVGNVVNYSGSKDDSRKWGRGSGMWTWGCDTVLIEKNEFRNANGPADSAGCHIDFNCKNIVVQYNVSENNAGGFCEILGNNHNCAYRYNISINDGYRVKKKGIAFQEGKIYWLSGFVGKDRERNGPYNSYFYNNTIYVKKEILAKMAVAKVAEGALIANNIFYIEGESKAVLGDQYQPQDAGTADIPDVVFQNNLFLKESNWPKDVMIQDKAPVVGNPKFKNAGGKEKKDYIPTNIKLVKDKGVVIEKIPNDKIGLFVGLKVTTDILGNPIKGAPDMGAIEIQ